MTDGEAWPGNECSGGSDRPPIPRGPDFGRSRHTSCGLFSPILATSRVGVVVSSSCTPTRRGAAEFGGGSNILPNCGGGSVASPAPELLRGMLGRRLYGCERYEEDCVEYVGERPMMGGEAMDELEKSWRGIGIDMVAMLGGEEGSSFRPRFGGLEGGEGVICPCCQATERFAGSVEQRKERSCARPRPELRLMACGVDNEGVAFALNRAHQPLELAFRCEGSSGIRLPGKVNVRAVAFDL